MTSVRPDFLEHELPSREIAAELLALTEFEPGSEPVKMATSPTGARAMAAAKISPLHAATLALSSDDPEVLAKLAKSRFGVVKLSVLRNEHAFVHTRLAVVASSNTWTDLGTCLVNTCVNYAPTDQLLELARNWSGMRSWDSTFQPPMYAFVRRFHEWEEATGRDAFSYVEELLSCASNDENAAQLALLLSREVKDLCELERGARLLYDHGHKHAAVTLIVQYMVFAKEIEDGILRFEQFGLTPKDVARSLSRATLSLGPKVASYVGSDVSVEDALVGAAHLFPALVSHMEPRLWLERTDVGALSSEVRKRLLSKLVDSGETLPPSSLSWVFESFADVGETALLVRLLERSDPRAQLYHVSEAIAYNTGGAETARFWAGTHFSELLEDLCSEDPIVEWEETECSALYEIMLSCSEEKVVDSVELSPARLKVLLGVLEPSRQRFFAERFFSKLKSVAYDRELWYQAQIYAPVLLGDEHLADDLFCAVVRHGSVATTCSVLEGRTQRRMTLACFDQLLTEPGASFSCVQTSWKGRWEPEPPASCAVSGSYVFLSLAGSMRGCDDALSSLLVKRTGVSVGTMFEQAAGREVFVHLARDEFGEDKELWLLALSAAACSVVDFPTFCASMRKLHKSA